jgi:hypothetical protein
MLGFYLISNINPPILYQADTDLAYSLQSDLKPRVCICRRSLTCKERKNDELQNRHKWTDQTEVHANTICNRNIWIQSILVFAIKNAEPRD